MTRKQNILNKIKSIDDPEILRKLEQWVDEACNIKSDMAKEEGKTYATKSTASKQKDKQGNANASLKWLQKIADEGGVSAIENPVEWQKKERRDRSLPIQ